MSKILILSIYNENEYYDAMLNETNQYIKTVNNKEFFFCFICYKPIQEDYLYDKERNILTINGTDSLIPGILNKTIDAIDIITNKMNIEYDFIFRTTVATCINIPKILSLLNKLDIYKEYYIGNLQKLEWIDIGCGIIDQTHWGTWYCGGGFAIFSKSIALKMVLDRDAFIMNVVDDLSIGIFIKQLPNIEYVNWHNLAEYRGQCNENKIVFFNNTNKHDRKIDVNNHKKIYTLFYK